MYRLNPSARRQPFGLTFSGDNAAQLAARVMHRPEAGVPGPALVVTPNLEHIALLRDAAFAAAYQRASLICADGAPVAAYARLRGAPIPGRVTGCAILHEVMRHPSAGTKPIFFVLESAATETALLAWAARQGFDRVATAVAPPALLADQAACVALAEHISAHGTALLVLTLGAPTSEIFAARYAAHLPRCWALCVGQAVRVELGLAARGPTWLGAAGLEWLWRLLREPRRLGPRYARAALWAPVAIWRDARAWLGT